MARMLEEKEMEYDIISGISVGGINAGALSLFEKGQEKEATQFMKDMWMNLTNTDVWAYWDGYEIYQALFNKSSILDNSPLEKFVTNVFEQFNYTLHRTFVLGAVDVETGATVTLDSDKMSKEDYHNSVIASAAVPVVFPFKEYKGQYLMDCLSSGWNVNMISGIDKCMQKTGGDPSKIVLDMIVMYPDRIEPWPLPGVNQTHFTTI